LTQRSHLKGFTLIELLIVIAIILILISIALPNFLEAQIRAKVAKANGEVRTLVIATEAYKADWKDHEPIPYIANPGPVSADPPNWNWWGFASRGLTTPIKYIGTLPTDPFGDSAETMSWWKSNKVVDPPYTVIRITRGFAAFKVGQALAPPLASIRAAAGGNVIIGEDFVRNVKHCGYIYYSSGPDAVDSSAWVCPQTYSPTNGTTSFGDIYAFGPGSPLENDNAHLLK
jgi:prepilin-type N-terminal cleavage/methylation domain-containing protein